MRILVLLLLVSCAEDKVTLGEACADMFTSFCERVVTCDTTSNFNGCFQGAMQACCVADGFCDEPSGLKDPVGYLVTCTAAIDNLSCQDTLAGVLPPTCWVE